MLLRSYPPAPAEEPAEANRTAWASGWSAEASGGRRRFLMASLATAALSSGLRTLSKSGRSSIPGRTYGSNMMLLFLCSAARLVDSGGMLGPRPQEHDLQPRHMQNRPSALASVHCGRFVFHGPSLRRTHYLERAQRSGVYGPTVSRYRQSAGCSADHQSRGHRRHRSRRGWRPEWCYPCRVRGRARR